MQGTSAHNRHTVGGVNITTQPCRMWIKPVRVESTWSIMRVHMRKTTGWMKKVDHTHIRAKTQVKEKSIRRQELGQLLEYFWTSFIPVMNFRMTLD